MEEVKLITKNGVEFIGAMAHNCQDISLMLAKVYTRDYVCKISKNNDIAEFTYQTWSPLQSMDEIRIP